MNDPGLILAFFSERADAAKALRRLRRMGFPRVALIHKTNQGKIHVDQQETPDGIGAVWGGLAGLALTAAFPALRIARAVPTLVGAATGYGLTRSLNQGVGEAVIERYKKSLTAGEVLILVEAPIRRLSRALAILRIDERVRPTTFIERISHLRAEDDTNGGGSLRESDTIERLAQRARDLARRHQPQQERSYNPILLRRLRENARVIDAVHNNLVEASRLEQPVSLSAEWLLDNSYVIRGQINEVQRSLTRAFYRELPVVETAPLAAAGRDAPRVLLPRVYALARELISHVDNRLDRTNLQAFIAAYQEIAPLSIAELWALPLMLRLALIENLRRLFVQTDRRQRDRERADFWANRLLNAARREPDQVLHFLSELSREQQNVRSHFADRLVSLLYDEGGVLEHVRSWLERKLDASFSEIIAFEQRRQAGDQISVSNAIGSQRFLNQLSWNEFFEELSVVSAELCNDPSGVYPRMDFNTRDLYRREVERIARKSPLDEQEVAREVVALAREKGVQGPSLLKHIGYYLVDDGYRELESRVRYIPPLKLLAQRTVLERPLPFYLGAIGAVTLGGAALITATVRKGGVRLPGVLGLAALLPVSEIGSQIVNAVVARCIKPRALPKMDFEKGIPDEWRCLVVVPMMLGSLEGIQSDIDNLEVHYLANTDPALRFALLADYTDASEAHLPADQKLLGAAQRGIEELNARYPDERGGRQQPRFFLFHRERRWCESEECWMGWERKRGKLEQLNAWLLGEGGDNLDELHLVGQGRSTLEGIRFVLTLDADAQLPHEAARHLIEAMAHPLNRPYAGEPVPFEGAQSARPLPQRGYSVIMPRVASTLPSATATRFSRLFAAAAGTDPYTHVSSDLYQDLFGESSYQGKGIYDVEVFHRALDRRFPESRILSHDLLEGAYVRVGLASDVEILDEFPPNYETYSRREHRWIRGDWQIASWVGSTIPTPIGTEKNPLSLLNRWKIADNLRRSLLAPAATGLLLLGWSLGARPAQAASTLAALSSFTPLFIQFAQQLSEWRWGMQEVRELTRVAQRSLVQTALIPHQAQLALDAIGRVFYRRHVSKKLLLEWQTASATYDSSHERETGFLLRMVGGAAFVLGVGGVIVWRARTAPFAAPFLALWAGAPLITKWLHGEVRHKKEVSPENRQYLRRVARRTWRYFDDFVGPQTNWLPPDNYQETLNVELAQRTSPTNIGLWLQSALAAFDFGYLPVDDAIKRMLPTLRTFDEMEKFNGHLLNWYNVQTLESLHPRYVSTVDSGNLLGSLVTVEQGVLEILDAPLLDCKSMRGLQDTLATLREVLPENSAARNVIAHLEKLFDCQSAEPVEIGRRLRAALPAVEQLLLLVADIVSESAKARAASANRHIAKNPRDLEQAIFDPRMEVSEAVYWAAQLEQTLRAWIHVADRYGQWLDLLAAQPEEWFHPLGTDARARRKELLQRAPSLNQMARGDVPALAELLEMRSRRALPTALQAWLDELAAEFGRSRWLAGEMIASAEELLDRTRKSIDEMDMAFLYDSKRRLFPVGFNLEDMRADSSYYDLLASECRIASFLAIARGQVPVEHWWALGRRYGKGEDQSVVLLSWSGTMFEYLMPTLYARGNDQSLLDVACRDAIEQQILYARRQNIPWGISEAAFSDLDVNRVYQYKAFGAPSLALQRGHDGDVVVAPYATMLALPHALSVSLRNLKRLQSLGAYGGYGFYESIDFSREHLGDDPETDYAVVRTRELWNVRRGVIVRAYMAHHQGMAFLALDNLLHRRETEDGEIGIMQARFHEDAFVRAATPLLYERVPPVPAVLDKSTMELAPERLPVPTGSGVGATSRFHSPDVLIPRTHLLSNGRYSIMLTSAGSGYSRWRSDGVQYDISRWRADTTTDERGSFIFVRDTETNAVWSATHQPLRRAARSSSVEYKPERVEYRRRETEIETITDVFVAPEDDCEIRRLTLVNHSSRPRTVEVTSYIELALNEHAADRAHPAFSKLFIQTESLPEESALLANRRLRSQEDLPIWAMHMIAEAGDWELVPTQSASFESTFAESTSNGATGAQNGQLTSPVYRRASEGFEFETDRAQFIGRGRTISDPQALKKPLSNTAGAVLDPIFSLRRRIYIGPNQRVQVSFVTGAGTTREEMLHLVEKYSEAGAISRALELAWTHAQLEMHHLRIRPDENQLFQQLASGVLYPHVAFRAPAARLRKNTLGQSTLWSYGISGDLPIFVVIIDHERDLPAVRQALLAHTFWHLHGLKVDLVLLNQQAGGYHQDLTDQLHKVAENFAQYVGIDTPGGIFIRAHETMPEEHLTLLLAAAHIVMVASRGRLTQQLSNLPGAPAHAPRLIVAQRPAEEASAELPFLELPYFNGYGGFTPDGREYAIYLGPEDHTPAPWINVMANPDFGHMASEAGQGFAWWGNSQANRMTGWSNDPVSDPINDAIYIRDDDTGVYWTPTSGPIREEEAYRTRHGQGYTVYEHNSHAIEQELLTFVPVSDSDMTDPASGEVLESPEPIRIQRLRLRNSSSRRRRLTITGYHEWVLGTDKEETQLHVVTSWDTSTRTLLAHNAYHPNYGDRVAFSTSSPAPEHFTADRMAFLGRNGQASSPAVLRRKHLTDRVGAGLDPCAAIQFYLELEPGESTEVFFLMGQGADIEEVRSLVRKYRDPGAVEAALQATKAAWDKVLGILEIETPIRSINFLLNRWLMYQNLSCRIWGRSAFYQSGGAWGFRDQLQDVMALAYSLPHIVREQILRAAAHQFEEGDVQHWWHEPSGAGVRTRITDDLLFLPYVVEHYIRVTGDYSVLDEEVPFLHAPPLEEGEHEKYFQPETTSYTASIYEHCVRAIERGSTLGRHGLPLIGAGDWNDGLNAVGQKGEGESVWLAWFLIDVLQKFAALIDEREKAYADQLRERATRYAEAVERNGWDGEWYRRAYYDDGTPLGSKESEEGKIDVLPQAWAVISGAGDPERTAQALASADQRLVKYDDKMVLLFKPPFDKTRHNPGYIKGYVPGVRENGGQYTHGALWLTLAYAMRGEGDKAVEILQLLNPVEHALNRSQANLYKVEPYAVAADVYSLKGQVGRGGWTWYTGSAAWMYRVWVEAVLGFHLRADRLYIKPAIPADWKEYSLRYRYGNSIYEIKVENPEGVNCEVLSIKIDGQPATEGYIPLVDEGKTYQVVVTLGKGAGEGEVESEAETETETESEGQAESEAEAESEGRSESMPDEQAP